MAVTYGFRLRRETWEHLRRAYYLGKAKGLWRTWDEFFRVLLDACAAKLVGDAYVVE